LALPTLHLSLPRKHQLPPAALEFSSLVVFAMSAKNFLRQDLLKGIEKRVTQLRSGTGEQFKQQK